MTVFSHDQLTEFRQMWMRDSAQSLVGPASIDLRLWEIRRESPGSAGFYTSVALSREGERLSRVRPKGMFCLEVEEGDFWHIDPGEFVLASTAETVRVPDDVIVTVHGKSTVARCGLQVHSAGLIDPGFCGQITLEMFNMGRRAIVVSRGDLICQITVQRLEESTSIPYSLVGQYGNQTGPRIPGYVGNTLEGIAPKESK